MVKQHDFISMTDLVTTVTIVLLIVLIWPQKFADFSKLVKIRSKNTFAPSNMMVRHAESSSGHDAKLREKTSRPILCNFTK